MQLTVADHYQAVGMPHPNADTMCQNRCEGTGWVPVAEDHMEEPWRALWLGAEAPKHHAIGRDAGRNRQRAPFPWRTPQRIARNDPEPNSAETPPTTKI